MMLKSHSFFRHCALALALLLPMGAWAADDLYTSSDVGTRGWNSNTAPQFSQTQKKLILGWYTLSDTQLIRLGSEYLHEVRRDGYRRFSNLFDFAYQEDRLVLGYQFMSTGMSLKRHSFWGIGGGLHASVGTEDKYVVRSTDKNTPFNLSGYVQLGIGAVLNLTSSADDITIPYVGFKGILGVGTTDGMAVYKQTGFGFNGIVQLGVYSQSDNMLGVYGLTSAVDVRMRYGFNAFGTNNVYAPPTGANAHEYVDNNMLNNQMLSEGRSQGISLMVNGMSAYQFSDLSWVYINLGAGYSGGFAYNFGVGVRIGMVQ